MSMKTAQAQVVRPAAALRVARDLPPGVTMVSRSCDWAERNFSTPLFASAL
jgi:hypothetical protein